MHPHSSMTWHPDCPECVEHYPGGPVQKMRAGKLLDMPEDTGRPIPAEPIPVDEFPPELVDVDPARADLP